MKLSKIFGIAALGGTLLVGGAVLTKDVTYSDGARVGTVPKFSHKGLVFKTWEGELAMLNFTVRGNNGALANTFEFSAKDPKVVEKLEEARDHGATVKLQYQQKLWHFPWERDTDYVITGVQPVEAAPSGPTPGR